MATLDDEEEITKEMRAAIATRAQETAKFLKTQSQESEKDEKTKQYAQLVENFAQNVSLAEEGKGESPDGENLKEKSTVETPYQEKKQPEAKIEPNDEKVEVNGSEVVLNVKEAKLLLELLEEKQQKLGRKEKPEATSKELELVYKLREIEVAAIEGAIEKCRKIIG